MTDVGKGTQLLLLVFMLKKDFTLEILFSFKVRQNVVKLFKNEGEQVKLWVYFFHTCNSMLKT